MNVLWQFIVSYHVQQERRHITKFVNSSRNVKQMPDYGKHVRWPAPPLVLRSMVSDFQSIHSRWRAHMILSNVPKSDWPQLRIKVSYKCPYTVFRYSPFFFFNITHGKDIIQFNALS